MRLFNQEIFNETLDVSGSGAARYSSAQYFDLLGEAESLVLQVSARHVSGTSPTLTVVLQRPNDGKDWLSPATLVNALALNVGGTTTTIVTWGNTQTLVPCALMRIQVWLGGTNPAAEVAVTACGRAEEMLS